MKLIVDEIFYSLRGEGEFIGQPAIFIRLSKCNLICQFCDTNFPTSTNKYFAFNNNPMTINEVIQTIKDIETTFKLSINHYVITGGEPLIQQKALLYFFQALEEYKTTPFIEIETNGTILPLEELSEYVGQYNVSLKLENSNLDLKLREKPKVIKWFVSDSINPSSTLFKFVVDKKEDLKEIDTLVDKYKINNISLMPCGTTPEIILEKMKWLAPICLQKGYQLSTRLHVLIWGNKRGV